MEWWSIMAMGAGMVAVAVFMVVVVVSGVEVVEEVKVSVGVEEFMLVETCNKNKVVTMTIGEVTMTIGKQYLLVDVDKGVAEAGAGVVGEAGLRILGQMVLSRLLNDVYTVRFSVQKVKDACFAFVA
ncbi:hypothetical protein SLE2022_239690 [Rubroshorea leprosula]